MVVGGYDSRGRIDDVDLVSLDPVNHPVPECLKQLGSYPTDMYSGGGAALSDGSLDNIITAQMHKCDVEFLQACLLCAVATMEVT